MKSENIRVLIGKAESIAGNSDDDYLILLGFFVGYEILPGTPQLEPEDSEMLEGLPTHLDLLSALADDYVHAGGSHA